MEVLLDRPDREGIQPLVVPLVFGSMAFRRRCADLTSRFQWLLASNNIRDIVANRKTRFPQVYFSRDLAPFELRPAADIVMRNFRLTWLMDCKFLWKLRDNVNGMIRPLVIHETGQQNAVCILLCYQSYTRELLVTGPWLIV